MSFSKSRVARFGQKQETLPGQKLSTTDFNAHSRDSARSQCSQKGIITASLNEPDVKSGTPKIGGIGDLTETKLKLKSTARKHNCSKIGKPNLSKKIKPKVVEHVEIEDVQRKDSYITVESCKSGPPSSRIPTGLKVPQPSCFGTLRATSFIASTGSPNKTQDFQKRNLEVQFNIKSKRLAMMKKDLLEKQKPAIELYKAIMNLRIKFKELEGKDLPVEEFKIIEYPEVKMLDERQIQEEEEKLREMKGRLQTTPTIFLDLCRQILDKRCEILDIIFDDESRWTQDELIKKIQNFKEESSMLGGRIESRLKEEEGKMRELIRDWYQIAKIHIGDGVDPSVLHAEYERKLQETEHKLKQAVADLQTEKSKKHKDLFDKNVLLERELKTMRDKYLEANKTLEEERTKSLCHKERQNILEHKLKTAKGRMKDAETVKQDLELQIEKLNEILNVRGEEWQSKDMMLDAKQKEIEQLVQAHKREMEKLQHERHSIDVRLHEQRNEFDLTEQVYLDKIQQLEFELNELKAQKANIESEYDILRVKTVNSEVEMHIHNMSKRKLEYGDTAEKSSTEMALWQELTATRSALKLAEEKLAIYAEEKTRFLDTITENFKEEDNTSIHMTTQLMQKEELISTLILQNKQLQESLDETQLEYEEKCMKIKETEEKLQDLNQQFFDEDVNTEKEIYDLHSKLLYEAEKNKDLEEKLDKALEDNQNTKEMLLDYENLLKIRDALLSMIQEKRHNTEEQNKSLKDYIVQMREQLNLLSIDKSKKEQELKTLTMLLDEKTGYIDTIEKRVAELEASVQEIKHKRVNLQEQICNADGELRVTRDKISRLNQRAITLVQKPLALPVNNPSRENMQQFINHAQNLCTQEVIRYRKRLHSRMAMQAAANRAHSAQDCTLDNARTRIVTTVSDIMRRYSNQGFDIKPCVSVSSNNLNQ